ncbi:hypothetical protein ES705_00949 [subsurface metagenome]|nr:hypothetical protein [Clostridia bacterium]
MLKEKFKHYKKVISSTSFKVLVWRLYRKILEVSGDALRNSKIIRKSYFLSDKNFFKLLQIKGNSNACIDLLKEKINKNLFLNSIIKDVDKKFIISKLPKREKNKIIDLADEICEHKFDLLGSGKVKISYSLKPKGTEGHIYNMNISCHEIEELKEKISNKINSFFKELETNDPIYQNFDYEPIDWHVDFSSGYRWDENTWYKKLKYGCHAGVEVKKPWELSRFHHLIILGQAYLITKNEKYSLEYLFQITDWTTSGPPYFGINWRSILDVALRVSNWVVSFSFFKESKFINKRFLLFLLKNMYIHGRHIVDNLEYYSITSNHYLSDISGLFFVGEIFNDFTVGKKWSSFAISELKKEIDKQVYDDGVDFESSTCYHRFVLELLFYPVLFNIKKSKDFNGSNYMEIGKNIFGENFINKIFKMFEFVLSALKPNGKLPQIGDNDNGQFFIFSKGEVLDMRYLLTFSTIFFRGKRFKIKEYGFSKEALWIFGKKGYEVWNQIEYNYLSNIGSISFTYAGLYIMRRNGNYLIASCSQNGQNGNGGHAHNDKLGFELFVGDRDVIVDPGSYFYTALPEWRNKFRSTSFHNTIMVDNKEQNRFKSDNLFSLENDSKVSVSKWKTTPDYDYLEAEHNGYNRFYNSVTHKRQFVFNKRENHWLIKDVLTGEGKHKFDLFFQLGPGIAYKIDKRTSAVEIYTGDKCLKIIPLFKKTLSLSVEEGWYSSGYGVKTKSKVLKYSKTSVLPVEFLFLLGLNNFIYQEKKINEIFSGFNI